MDQAADVALPPKLAPVNVMAEGVAEEQTVIGGPGVTVGAGRTVIVRCVNKGNRHGTRFHPWIFEVKVRITVPVKSCGWCI